MRSSCGPGIRGSRRRPAYRHRSPSALRCFELYPTIKDRGLDRYYANALAGEVHVLSERFHRFLIPVPRNIQSIGLSEMAQSARIAPLTVGQSVVGTITVIEDVTERVVSERELRNQIAASERARNVAEEASRLKDEFLATMSHEIRTPLNAVLGWTRILRTQPRLKTRDHALEVIERNAASQLRLVEDLLDMARVISGKLRLELKTIPIEDVVRAAIDVVTPGAAAKNITIIHVVRRAAALPSTAISIACSRRSGTCMSNAVKFTEPAAVSTCRLPGLGGIVELTVRDTGRGLRVTSFPTCSTVSGRPTRRRAGGTAAWASAWRSCGRSSSFTADPSPRAAPAPTAGLRLSCDCRSRPRRWPRRRLPAEPVTLKGIHMLIVDDNEDGREMLKTALRDYGAIVHVAASAAEAMDVARAQTGPRCAHLRHRHARRGWIRLHSPRQNGEQRRHSSAAGDCGDGVREP